MLEDLVAAAFNDASKKVEEATKQKMVEIARDVVEGEATAYYITELAEPFNKRTSRIARGVPSGSDLDYVDGRALANALMDRKIYTET